MAALRVQGVPSARDMFHNDGRQIMTPYLFEGDLRELSMTLEAVKCVLQQGTLDGSALNVIARSAGGQDGAAAVRLAYMFRKVSAREQQDVRTNALVQFGMYVRRHGLYSKSVLGMLLLWQLIDLETADLMVTAHRTAAALEMDMALS
ncbi:MAG: hypothetical protein G01um101425_238 [Candidatus Peregrinibacteria bacterium Gr01-1014_25]|nr:MAG: hypothetical protein G01um101425_238 [Candidatus Peregrinibacteria bacterium Gr01-1014_25]